MKELIVSFLTFVVVMVFICLFWAAFSYEEAQAYNQMTGEQVTWFLR